MDQTPWTAGCQRPMPFPDFCRGKGAPECSERCRARRGRAGPQPRVALGGGGQGRAAGSHGPHGGHRHSGGGGGQTCLGTAPRDSRRGANNHKAHRGGGLCVKCKGRVAFLRFECRWPQQCRGKETSRPPIENECQSFASTGITLQDNILTGC